MTLRRRGFRDGGTPGARISTRPTQVRSSADRLLPLPGLNCFRSATAAEDDQVRAWDAHRVALAVLFEEVDEVDVELLEQVAWHRFGSGLHGPGRLDEQLKDLFARPASHRRVAFNSSRSGDGKRRSAVCCRSGHGDPSS